MGAYVYCEVEDDGCGMSEEVLANIFDPFFTTKFTGRGLGLSAVLGIVHSHSGVIDVQSHLSIGTRFRVCFPALPDNAERKTAPPRFSPGDTWHCNATVLVVDDEPAVLEVAREMLERFGLQVLTATSGREAIDTFRQHPKEIACVLLDLTMPEIGGEETYSRLRELRPDLPILLSSGYDGTDARERLNVRKEHFLRKPYRVRALRSALSLLLDGP